MANEISLADSLKQSLERTKWAESGVRGFLIGRIWRGAVYVLNVWANPSNDAGDKHSKCGDLIGDLTACRNHLCAGTDIVGVVVVTKSSKLTDAEEHLSSLPLEVQTAVPGPLFVVGVLQPGSGSGSWGVTFHQYTADDKSLKPLAEKPVVDGFDKDQVIFRLKARLPMQLQLDNSQPTDIEVWGEKMCKAFTNVETAISSGGYTYGFHSTQIFLTDSGVVGTNAKMTTVQHLCDAVASETGEPPSRKKNVSMQPPVLVDMYQQVSGETDHFAQPTCAPAVHQRTGSFRFLKLTLPVDVVVEVDGQEKVGVLSELFSTAVTTQLRTMHHCLLLHQSKENEFYTPEPFHFSLPQRHTCVTVLYPRGLGDSKLEKQRQYLHRKMCLGLEKPVFRRGNARLFPGQLAEGGYIIDPHIGLPPSKVAGGTVHLVQGHYTYHHYMQDRFDDNKWGCAYRSLQTIVSWFRFQGYTDIPIPTHRQIQQALVAVGDKDNTFVGSKKWIGSFEVSFCLDHLLGVTSKFLSVSEGTELESKGRELAEHFDTEGTPIMIGGGALAHTILGVDYNEMSGDIKFLILDPHYTGGEDLPTIHREGWCGWKGPDFWNPMDYYNMCMPTRPTSF